MKAPARNARRERSSSPRGIENEKAMPSAPECGSLFGPEILRVLASTRVCADAPEDGLQCASPVIAGPSVGILAR